MSAITDFKAAVDAHLDTIDGKVDTLVTGVTGIADDVAFLKEEIAKLTPAPGDAEALAAIVARVSGLSDKVGGVTTTVTELDAQTTRPTPPTP